MGTDSTLERLDAWLASEYPEGSLAELALDPPPDLVQAITTRLADVGPSHLKLLVQLLTYMGVSGRPPLLEVLGRDDGTTVMALRALSAPDTPLDYERLVVLLRSRTAAVVKAAIGAAGFVDDPRVADEVYRHWDSDHQSDVALCLGRRRALQYTPALVALLDGDRGGWMSRLLGMGDEEWEFAAVALEAMADPACVPEVRRLLHKAPRDRVRSLVQVLRAASGEDRLADWIGRDQEPDFEILRSAWLEKNAPSLGVHAYEQASRSIGEFLLQGTNRVRMGYPQTTSATNWARWGRALYSDGEVLYRANSDCPTCETFLRRAGATRPRVDADQVGEALAHVIGLSRDLLSAIEPALLPLPSGRCIAALVDLELERIDEDRIDASWYSKRGQYRSSTDPDDDPNDVELPDMTWPGTSHYQATHLIRDRPPTSLTVMPTQSTDRFDEDVIAARTTAMANGQRPAALALGWFERRSVRGRYPEAMLQMVLLDGHHTVEAYARAQARARLLVISPVEFGDSRGMWDHLRALAE